MKARLSLSLAPAGGGCPGLERDIIGDAVQPAPNCVTRVNGIRLLGKNEKRRLKRVLGILLMRQHSSSYAKNHRAMTKDDCLKCRFIATADETAHQLGIGRL